MTWLRVLMLLCGLGLLYWVLQASDLRQVAGTLGAIGLSGAVTVASVYLLTFVVDTLSWQLAVPSAALGPRWLYRLWKVRMVGEAFNISLPTAVSGEPVKVLLLKRHYGILFQEGGASLVIAKTVNLLALVAFATMGLVAMLQSGGLPQTYNFIAFAGLAGLALASFGFFAVQRWRVASRLAHLLAARWPFGGSLDSLLTQIDAVEGYFHNFYERRPHRFAAALALAFLNWCLSMAEIWLVMSFLGHPVGWAEACTLAALVELVRAAAFFIPAGLGAIELTLLLSVEALTGQPSLGLAVGLVRRAREILWIAWGLALGWTYSSPPAPAVARVEAAKAER